MNMTDYIDLLFECDDDEPIFVELKIGKSNGNELIMRAWGVLEQQYLGNLDALDLSGIYTQEEAEEMGYHTFVES